MRSMLYVERGPLRFTHSSNHPFEAIKILVTFAARHLEVEDFGLHVEVTHASYFYRGRAWRRRVLLRIGDAKWFPMKGHSYPGLKTAPVYDLMDWQEAVVKLAAHEFQHVRQFRARTTCSEIEADKVALHVLGEFRARRAQIDQEIAVAREKVVEAMARVAVAEQVKKERAAARKATAKAPETRLAQVQAKQKTWRRKAALAETKLKKLGVQARRLEREIAKQEVRQ